MTIYEAVVWVHPKDGGDDMCYELEFEASDRLSAEKVVRDWLKSKRSAILDDFRIKPKVQQY